MNDRESKYLHLLQPIRDLATNWNIDIAHELEDYLEDLEAVHITFDPDDQDATIIKSQSQPSQAFSQSSQSSQTSTSLNFAEAALLIQGTACIYSRKVEYLYALVYQTLDHLAQQSTSTAANDEPMASSSQTSRKENRSKTQQYELISLALAEADANVLPLVKDLDPISSSINISSNQEKTKKNRREPAELSTYGSSFQAAVALMATLVPDERDHGNAFKLITSDIHSGGALLIESEGEELNSKVPVLSPLREQGSPSPQPGITYPQDYDDDDIQEFDNVDMIGDDDTQNIVANTTLTENDKAPSIPGNSPGSLDEHFVDPWLPLDPHDVNPLISANNQSFQKGKTFFTNISGQLSQHEKKKDGLSKLSDCIGCPFKSLRVPLDGVIWRSFSYALVHGAKSAGFLQSSPSFARKRVVNNTDGNPSVDAKDTRAHDMDVDDWNYNDMENGYDSDDFGPIAEGPSTEELSQPVALEAAFSDVVNENYEDLCRSHVSAFMQGAEKYAKETNLSRQVATWQHKLNPILQEQNSHPPFDIHTCGGEIIDYLGTVSREEDIQKDFSDVVRGKSQYEICRLFLASLQLANNGNVELFHEESPEDASSAEFRLQLVSSENCYDAIQLASS